MSRLLILAAALCTAAAACSGAGGDLPSSTVAVLVPADPAFEATLTVDTVGGPDNYLVRSNWSAEYDPSVDRALVIESYQIGDPSSWTAESLDDGHEATRLAFVAMVTDARRPGPDGPCAVIDAEASIVRCSYPVGRADPAIATIRTADPHILQIVVGDQPQALAYLLGAFDTVTPAEAEVTYPRD